jgi:thymidylate kinase
MTQRAQGFDFSDANPEVYQRMKKNFDPVPRAKNVIRVDTSKPVKPYVKKIETKLKAWRLKENQ